MRLPDFLLIGAAKSGTTALFYYLGQHPGVYPCPVREPSFFALEGHTLHFAGPGDRATVGTHAVTDLAAYGALFEGAAPGQVAGEVSPLYLYDAAAPARIKAHIPQAKLIVILRNPVERAYASYLHLRRDGREPCNRFEEALSREQVRIASGWEHLWHYVAMGRYATQLQRYLSVFDPAQLLLIRYDEFQAAPAAVVQQCFEFLGVDAGFAPSFARRPNRSGEPRSRLVQRVVGGQGRMKQMARWLPEGLRGRLLDRVQRLNLARPAMDSRARRSLEEAYQDEIHQLQELTGWDLSDWLTD